MASASASARSGVTAPVRRKLTIPGMLTLTLLALTGCNALQKNVVREYEEDGGWATAATYSTADVRIVTQRPHPVLHNQVVCTEPSPDVAKALSTVSQLSAQGGSGAVTAGLSLGSGSAEAAIELAGRSTAVLGLRDGLYHACEAYANGSIGADAYALVLSRYGQLMTTLFLGQDISAAAGSEAKTAIASAALALAGQQTSAGTPTTKTPTTTTKPPAPGASATGSSSSAQLQDGPPSASAAPSGAKLMLAVLTQLAQSTPAQDAATKGAAAKGGSTPGGSTPGGSTPGGSTPGGSTPGGTTPGATTPGATTPGATTPGATTPGGSTPGVANPPTSALALTRMNEDFFNLDFNLLNLLVVACVNEADPTRLHATKKGPGGDEVEIENHWLAGICEKLADIDTIRSLDEEAATLAVKLGLTPINPVPAAAAAPGETPPAKKSAAAADPVVLAAQTALKKDGEDPGTLDGKTGPNTVAAIKKYQAKHNLTVNGQLDANTLMTMMGLKAT